MNCVRGVLEKDDWCLSSKGKKVQPCGGKLQQSAVLCCVDKWVMVWTHVGFLDFRMNARELRGRMRSCKTEAQFHTSIHTIPPSGAVASVEKSWCPSSSLSSPRLGSDDGDGDCGRPKRRGESLCKVPFAREGGRSTGKKDKGERTTEHWTHTHTNCGLFFF
jgi:hypothetical protein